MCDGPVVDAHRLATIHGTGCGFDSHAREIIFPFPHSDWQKVSLSSAIQHTKPPEFCGGNGIKYLKTRFPGSLCLPC